MIIHTVFIALLLSLTQISYAQESNPGDFERYCKKSIADHAKSENILKYIRKQLQVADCMEVEKHLLEITDFNTFEGNVPTKTLEPLSYFENLKSITLPYGSSITNLKPLENLTQLKLISMNGTQVRDLTPLQNLKSLETINIRTSGVTDLTPIMELSNLKDCDFRNLKISKTQRQMFTKKHPSASVLW